MNRVNRIAQLLHVPTAAYLILAALGFGNMSCVPAAGPPDNEVYMRGIAFVPEQITIHVGETVTWTNQDFARHTVTSGRPDDDDFGTVFRSRLLSRGQSFSFAFNVPGDYEYFCEPHASTMFGAHVIVIDPASSPP